MTELQSNPPVQGSENVGEISQVISLTRAIITSISVFVLLMILPVGTLYVIPKFKIIFTDMLGEGEGLPEFTLLVLNISDIFSNNLIVSLPIFLVFAVICAGFLGFQQMFLPRNICKLLSTLFVIIYLGIFGAGVIAMFLPLIKMMDKLGQ